MLEGLAAWVLNNYLGQYFENLQTDQLSIGLLNGVVELENLPLRKDALKKFQLPLQIEAGFVGKVRLEIPLTRLRSEPWIVMFEQLYLVVTPINLTEYDEEAEARAAFANKMSHLDIIEAAWRSQVIGHDTGHYDNSYLNWASYGTNFMSHILENIQLKVKDVHIRYEDNQTFPEKAFSFGIKIDSFFLQSSDEHWVPKFIYLSGKEMSYKLLELKNFVVYIETSPSLFSKKSLAELAAAMHPAAYERKVEYIIEPTNCVACLKRNLSATALRSRSTPRFICDLKVQEFFLVLTNHQCELLLATLKLYRRLEIARGYRKWRPKCAVMAGGAARWWRFAIDCTRAQVRRKYGNRNWPFVLQRARDLCNYVDIYCDYLVSPAGLDEASRGFKIRMEEELNFEPLGYIRDFCMEKATENVHLNSLKTEATAKPAAKPVGKGSQQLQSWFPTWSGWYGNDSQSPPLEEAVVQAPPSLGPSSTTTTSLEEEILYVISDSLDNNTYIKRDAVFCHVSFSMQRCTVTLGRGPKVKEAVSKASDTSNILFQLEFGNVRAGLESRPRNQAYKCDVHLGSMSLKDYSTKNTAFPLLIASNQRETMLSAQKGGLSKTSSMYERLSSIISSVSRLSQGTQADKAQDAESLLSLTYEKKPRNSKFENKLVVRSQTIDVIYNQQAFESIWYFFSKFNLSDSNQEVLAWTEAAKKRYEQIKQQTKDELKRNWNALFKKSLNTKRSRWDIQLDISAPQIIFPEHFGDVNATLVVVDLGKLVFSTSNVGSDPTVSVSETTYESDNDTFATPCSTPEELLFKEELKGKSSHTDSVDGSLSEKNIHNHLYDKYDLKLCDIQVLVAKVKDNWKFACAKGTGSTHVVERFSINLHLEKRLFAILPECASINEYQWPHFALSGTLPHLTFHINENKVQALKNLFVALSIRPPADVSPNAFQSMHDNEVLLTKSNTLTELNADAESINHSEDTELIIMQFAVDKLSVQLQSRGNSIAELQVTGVRTKVSKRPSDSTALLTVHSLLLVDALQTFGPDFELLIASNKHIGMDSVSGKLLDSDPCSPVSPSSPDPNIPVSSHTSINGLNQALSTLASNRAQSPGSDKSWAWSPPFVVSPTFNQQFGGYDERDSEALISLEVVHLYDSSLIEDDSQYIVSIQFNSLDIIANQETVVELVGFFHQIFSSISDTTSTAASGGPGGVASCPNTTAFPPDSANRTSGHYGSLTSLFEDPRTIAPKIQVLFDFHKLTVLLLRGVAKDNLVAGRKVATAVISNAKIDLSVESDLLTVEGSLGGFQIRDVTPDGNKHQCLISIGHDPIVESAQSFRSHNGVYMPVSEINKKYTKAFSFKIFRPLVLNSQCDLNITSMKSTNQLTIELRIATVCYVHCPQFLLELKSCATEFKQYMIKVAGSIRQAATEMAMGLVSKRIETFANLATGSREGTLRRQRTMSLSRSTDTLHFPNPPPASKLESQALSPTHTLDPDLSFNVILDVVLETPLIVLPESPNSTCVLVAHLGQISLRNLPLATDGPPFALDDELLEAYPVKLAEFEMKIREISLYSLNVDDRLKARDGRLSPLTTTMMYAQELYNCQQHGSPILHNTGLDLVFTHQKSASLLTEFESGLFFPTDVYFDQPQPEYRDSYQVEGKVVTHLKVSVSRSQYHQIRKTLSNISIQQSSDAPKSSSHTKLDPIREVTQHEEKKHESDLGDIFSRRSIKNFKPIKGKFVVPNLRVELVGHEAKPLVDFLLQDIVTTYEAKEPYKSDTQISLKSLTMEDLQLCGGKDATHRFLIKSELVGDLVESEDRRVPKFISSSCPKLGIDAASAFLSASLPSKLEMEQPFFARGPAVGPPFKRGFGLEGLKHKNDYDSSSSRLCNAASPDTPPPSPVNTADDVMNKHALMTITVQNIDERHAEFVSKYNETNKFVDIDFNNLLAVINIESWVMVLDFFTGSVNVPRSQTSDHYSSIVTDHPPIKELNIVTEVKVNSLTIVFNEPKEELARASINHVVIRSVGSAGNANLTGRLGSLSLLDSTADGHLYKNKFLTTGREAITFQLFRYNDNDPDLLRECDIRLKLVMSSIMYVHSQKFTMRLVQFFYDFFSLRLYVSDWRLVTAGVQVHEPKHGIRASLDITADAPIICLPMSSQSDKLLVLDLGSLSVSNKFHFAGSSSTISEVRRGSLKDHLSSGAQSDRSRSSSLRSRSSSLRSRSRSNKRKISGGEKPTPLLTQCLLDVMQVQLTNMDVFVGTRAAKHEPSAPEGCEPPGAWQFGSFVVNRKGCSVLREKCAMRLQVERNLDAHKSKIVPDFSVHGLLTKVHASMDQFTYKLVRGLMTYNIAEPLPQPNSSTLFTSFLNKSKAQSIPTTSEKELWTNLSIDIELDNVTMETDNGSLDSGSTSRNGFARVDFVNSRLIFKKYSNWSSEIDLVSNEILLSDIRSNDSTNVRSTNVFTGILSPAKNEVHKDSLQAEVHYRFSNSGQTCKILLNKMRLMIILEWWKELVAFLGDYFPNPNKSANAHGKNAPVVPDFPAVVPTSYGRYNPRLNPVLESTGLMTRYNLIAENPQPTFELNFNIIESEVIIVENSSIIDSPALILQTTAILTYQPDSRGQPLSCSLNHCELYSCVLGDEKDTALSIVDPVNVYISVNDLSTKALLGDISNIAYKNQHVVEISLQHLNIRLSYHDLKMFQGILESIPEQTEQARRKTSSADVANKIAQVGKLCELGFSLEDCQKAVKECSDLDEAAIWLTKNASLQRQQAPPVTKGKNGRGLNIQNIELRTESVHFCIIDDCGDCDVPLLEASFMRLEVYQDYGGKGSAKCTMSVDYFNRFLSAWEPFIEPWRCNLQWHRRLAQAGQCRTNVHLGADQVIDITVTSALIELLNIVKRNWLEDFYSKERGSIDFGACPGEQQGAQKVSRKRTPFVPFSIKNDTGCSLAFSPLEQNNTIDDTNDILRSLSDDGWTRLPQGETTSFSFLNKGKQRHGNARRPITHRIVVKVEGMESVGPVSIDKVGVFFRLIGTPAEYVDRMVIVFSITMDGLARKLITIRSALLLKNILPFSVDIKMDNTHLDKGGMLNLTVPSMSTISIPLMYTWAKLYIRPYSPDSSFRREYVQCTEAVNWRRIFQTLEGCCQNMYCDSIMTTRSPLRFFAYVKSDNFPQLQIYNHTDNLEANNMIHPGHTIVIVSQITLVNLLPSDLHYEMNSVNKDSGMIKPGHNAFLSTATSEDTSEFEIRLGTDNFRATANVLVRPSNCPYSIRVKLEDGNERPVIIQLHAALHHGKALKLSVSAHYWLINKTALPLVFKQEAANIETAGQEREHEIARCTTPLIFSFSDQDAAPTLLIRIGKQYHPETVPQFCKMLPLTQGTLVRRLIARTRDQRPDFVYIIGIDVRPGRGRYSRTHMVTFSPRFHIENNSRHQLLLSQKYFASFGVHDSRYNWLRATPGCSLPFHWPRLDMDPLLVVRIEDIPDCLWSGGFLIEKANSFNLNVRNSSGQSFFLHVEIILMDATFFTVITDADFLPPSFRIDNYSEVPITYYQTGTREAVLRSSVRPLSSVPYAWDEITLPPYITCVAPGGTTATYSFNGKEKGANLEYENFLYIAFSATFPKSKTTDAGGSFSSRKTSQGGGQQLKDPTAEDLHSASLEFLQLVLDVVEGSRVSLNRKQPSCRSQLWRMTAEGMLHHEGSSPPFDPNCKRRQNDSNILVLDIAGSGTLPLQYTSLMLRKPDPRRRLTQTWSFTQDGRLCCQQPNLYVQAKDGFMGLHAGNEVVLGPPQKVQYGLTAQNVPLEQAICRQRLRPGSGCLTVEVIADGPTRVLQITDVRETKFPQIMQTQRGEIVSMRNTDPDMYSVSNTTTPHSKSSSYDGFEIEMNIAEGVGLSLISSREELFYARLSGIVLDYVSSSTQQTLDFSVRDIQMDNQLESNQCQVIIYVTPHSKNDDTRHMPSLQFSAQLQRSPPHLNAYIFKNLNIKMKNLTVTIEEEMLCKTLAFCGLDETDLESEHNDEDHQYDTSKLLLAATSSNAKRYYFSHLKVALDQVKLSVLTCKSITSDLRSIRRKLGLRLVQFENALISLTPFVRLHPFETWNFLVDSIKNHYEMELKSQAIRILGSVDFLGNPIGFLSDVSEGVQEFVLEGSVSGLFMNVAHGISNSTAKMAESLSSVVGRATMDKKHEAIRQKLASRQDGSGSDHLVSGVKGLTLGFYGGLTSVVTQTYTGAANEGIPGFFSGFAKGVIGTVTKPTSGILDLAIGTASAIRDTSKNPSLKPPSKIRKPRIVVGINGVTPRYNVKDALGQELFRMMSPSPGEIYHSYEIILNDKDLQRYSRELKMLTSSTNVYFFTKSLSNEPPTFVLQESLSEIHHVRTVELMNVPYIELVMDSVDYSSSSARLGARSPKVQCESIKIAEEAAKQINHVKVLHEELKYIVHEEK